MARTNPEGKALVIKLVRDNPDTTLGDAQRAAKEAKVKFSPPSFYSWKREALGGGGGGGGRGRRGRGGRGGGGGGLGGGVLEQVHAQLQQAQRMEKALRQIADILDQALARR
jgi:hypothetical protein